MVPWGMAFVVGATGGMAGSETGTCTAAFEMGLVVDGGVDEGVLVVLGDGAVGDDEPLASDTTATSAGAEAVETDCGTGGGSGLSRDDTGMLSAAGGVAEGGTTATIEGGSDRACWLMGTAAMAAGTGESAREPVPTGAGLNAAEAEGPSGEVIGGTTVSAGRSGFGATRARISSGLRPSNSAF